MGLPYGRMDVLVASEAAGCALEAWNLVRVASEVAGCASGAWDL